jgi:hypothetical protein
VGGRRGRLDGLGAPAHPVGLRPELLLAEEALEVAVAPVRVEADRVVELAQADRAPEFIPDQSRELGSGGEADVGGRLLVA